MNTKNTDHGVATWEESRHVGSFRARVKALVAAENPVAEELPPRVKKLCNLVGIQAGPEGTYVQLVELRDVLQKVLCPWANPRVIPWGGRPIKLKVMDILHVSRDLVVGGVDEGLVKVD